MTSLETLAHPNLSADARRLDHILNNPPDGLLQKYPELYKALQAQLPGLVSRDQMFAHNAQSDLAVILGLFRGENFEVVESVVTTIKDKQRVNGKTSLEGADSLVFGSLYTSLVQARGEKMSPKTKLEIEGALRVMRGMKVIWPSFDHVGALQPTVEKNWRNYPERVLKAPPEWDSETMTHHYLTKSKPALRALRNKIGGVLSAEITEHLNEKRESLPSMEYYRVPGFELAYLKVLATIVT